MHFNNFLAFAGVSLFALGGVQAASNFVSSCNSIKMASNNVLQANCRKGDGTYSVSSLNLNQCVVNNNSYLACQPNGNYANSCVNCQVPNTGVMSCLCNPGQRYATLNLNQCVGNNNGQLVC